MVGRAREAHTSHERHGRIAGRRFVQEVKEHSPVRELHHNRQQTLRGSKTNRIISIIYKFDIYIYKPWEALEVPEDLNNIRARVGGHELNLILPFLKEFVIRHLRKHHNNE